MTHTPTSILDTLLAIIKKEYKIDTSTFNANTTLEDTGLDSLSVADLLFEVEDRFEIQLGDMSPDQIPDKLSGLIKLVEIQLAKKS